MFYHFDTDGSGALDEGELRAGLASLGVYLGISEVRPAQRAKGAKEAICSPPFFATTY